MEIRDVPVAKAEMLIRKPVAQVFEAFVDPAITSKFWFTKGSGRLEAGKRIRWDWEMYDVLHRSVLTASPTRALPRSSHPSCCLT